MLSMNRIAALFAIIAFAVMSTGMARAQSMAMPAMITMADMAHDGDRQLPCDQMTSLSCNACCIVIAPLAAIHPAIGGSAAGFLRVDFLSQIGRMVPPALPPPRD